MGRGGEERRGDGGDMRSIVRPTVLFLFVWVLVLNGIEGDLSTNSHQLNVNASKLNCLFRSTPMV